ncbi:MAG: hypothetical protein JXA30_19000 [Deltaproteobacteria bacterium]|nr:hypothetical protein [Deltaproteobacteria bacterium]
MWTILRKPLVLALFSFLVSLSSVAQAATRGCFSLPDEEEAGLNMRASSSRRVTLASRILTDKQCEYALSPDGPWSGDSIIAKSGETDFVGLAAELQKKLKGYFPERINTVFARQKAAKKIASQVNIESVFLASCTEYLLSEGRGFTLSVPIETQKPTITRSSGEDECGVPKLSLHFLPIQYDASLDLISSGPWASTLQSTKDKITLDPGGWAIYAARTESPTGYLIGRIHSTSSLTPLRIGMRSFAAKTAQKPWLRPAWHGGSFRLEPATEGLLQSDNWAELRTAAAANALWLARSNPAEREPTPVGRLILADDGKAVALPTDTVTELMVDRYGEPGRYLVPTLDDWQAVSQGLEVCLAPRYQPDAALQPVSRLPSGSSCVGLGAMTEPMTIQAAGGALSGQICLSQGTSVMTAFNARRGSEQKESCVTFATQASGAAKPDFLIASIGDSVYFSGSGSSRLFICTDNRCASMPQGNTRVVLDKPGLVEVRLAESRDQANSIQGLTLLRLGVIDPATEWHPVGLYTSNKPPPSNRWTMLEYDEEDVFTYIRRDQELRFRFSTSSTVPAAFNARTDLPSQITQDIPVIGHEKGKFPGTKPSTFVALVTEDEKCPAEPAAKFRRSAQVNPDDLLIDQVFYVHLAQYHGEDQPYRCISRAAFRVAERWSISASSIVRLGLLGDTQAVLFVTREAALGLALPLGYAYLRLIYGVGIDASLSLTAASTLLEDDALLTRAGLGLSAALVWGPEAFAPRLVSIGGMLHAATGTDDEPLASLYFALNLATLIDMAGGR